MAVRWTNVMCLIVALVLPLATSFKGAMFSAMPQRPLQCTRQSLASLQGASFLDLCGRRGSMGGLRRAFLEDGHKALRRSWPLTMVLAAKEGIEYDEVDLKKLKVAELKDLCKSMGLSQVGKKNELIERLLEAQEERLEDAGESASSQLGRSPGGEDDDDFLSDGDDDILGGSEADAEWPDVEGVRYSARTGMDKRLPSVEDLQAGDMAPDLPESPSVAGGVGRLVTQPRTGNCWHGKTVKVCNIKTASSPEPPTPVREDRMTCSLYMCEGSTSGKETSPDLWQQVGTQRGVQLPTVVYGEPDAYYGAVPLNVPVLLKPGETRGFCLFTDSWRGVILRAKLGSRFEPGDATDEDAHLRLGAGLLPVSDGGFIDGMFKKVYSETVGDAFVGAIEYQLVD